MQPEEVAEQGEWIDEDSAEPEYVLEAAVMLSHSWVEDMEECQEALNSHCESADWKRVIHSLCVCARKRMAGYLHANRLPYLHSGATKQIFEVAEDSDPRRDLGCVAGTSRDGPQL